MTGTTFTPVFYSKEHCPFCMKLQIFLLEAGLLKDFEVREHKPGTDQEKATKAELRPHFETISFPTVQIEPGKYMKESDDLIAHYAAQAKVDPSNMPVTKSFINGSYLQLMLVLPPVMEFHKKIMDAMKQMGVVPH